MKHGTHAAVILSLLLLIQAAAWAGARKPEPTAATPDPDAARFSLCMLGSTAAVTGSGAPAAIYDVRAFGARGDGNALDTRAIQSAIDRAAQTPGGEVYVPAGTYRTVTIRMRSGVSLYLAEGAVLAASGDQRDWAADDRRPVLSAYCCDNIAIRGPGTIDGGGAQYYGEDGSLPGGYRPNDGVMLANCRNVEIDGIKIQNSVTWALALSQCEHAVIRGVTVCNPDSGRAPNTDGLDLVDCRYVVATGLTIRTGDDGIVIKSVGDAFQIPARDCHDILIEDCVVATTANATKIGTETRQDIYRVTFRNITVERYAPDLPAKGYAAIALESNDGGSVHDIVCQGYTIRDCDTPIFLALQDRQSEWVHSSAGQLYNITLRDIACAGAGKASQINTSADAVIRNVTFDNVEIHNAEDYAGLNRPPFLTGGYPDAWVSGCMPAYGLFARNVSGLTLTDSVVFRDDGGSGRPATSFERVTGGWGGAAA